MPKITVLKGFSPLQIKMHDPVYNGYFRFDHVFFKALTPDPYAIHIYGIYFVFAAKGEHSSPSKSVWCTAPPSDHGPAGYDRKPLKTCYTSTPAKREIAQHIVSYGIKNNFLKPKTIPMLAEEVSKALKKGEYTEAPTGLPILIAKIVPIPANKWPTEFGGHKPSGGGYAYCFHAIIPVVAFQNRMAAGTSIPGTPNGPDMVALQQKDIQKVTDAEKKAKEKASKEAAAQKLLEPDPLGDSSAERGSGDTLKYVSSYKLGNIFLYVPIVVKVLEKINIKMKEYGITFPKRPVNMKILIHNLQKFSDDLKSNIAPITSNADLNKNVILAFDTKFKLTDFEFGDKTSSKAHPHIKTLRAKLPFMSPTTNALIYHLIHIYKQYQTTYGAAEWHAPEIEIRKFLLKYIYPKPLILNTAAGEYIAEKFLLGDKRLLNDKFWKKYKQFPMSANVKMNMQQFAKDSYTMIGDALGFKYASGGFQQMDDFDDFYEQCLEWIDLSKIIKVAAVCIMKSIGADEWIDKICKDVVDEFEKHRDAIIGWLESQEDPSKKAFAKELKDLMFAGENYILKQTESAITQGTKALIEWERKTDDRSWWSRNVSVITLLNGMQDERNKLANELKDAPLNKEPSGLTDKVANLNGQLLDIKAALELQKQRETDLGSALPDNEKALSGQLDVERRRIETKLGKLKNANKLREEQLLIFDFLLKSILPSIAALNPYLSPQPKDASYGIEAVTKWFKNHKIKPQNIDEAILFLNSLDTKTTLAGIAQSTAGKTVLGKGKYAAVKLNFAQSIGATYKTNKEKYATLLASPEPADNKKAAAVEDAFDSLLTKVSLLLAIIQEKSSENGSLKSLLKEGVMKGGKDALMEIFDKDQRKRALLCAAIFGTVAAAIYGVYYLIDNWDEVSVGIINDLKKIDKAIEKRFELFLRTDYPIMDILESLKEAAKQIGLNLLKDLVVNTIMWLVDLMQAACAEEEMVAAPYSPFGQVSLGDFMAASETNNNLTSGEGVLEGTPSFSTLKLQTNLTIETFNIILNTLSEGLTIREVCSLLEETANMGAYMRAIQILENIPQVRNTSFYNFYVNIDGIRTFFQIISKDIKPQYCILAKQAFEKEKEMLLNICVDPNDDVLSANLSDYLNSEDIIEALANRKKSNLDKAGAAAKFLGDILDGPAVQDPMCGTGDNSLNPRHESQQYAADQAGDAIFQAIEGVFERDVWRVKSIYNDKSEVFTALHRARQESEAGEVSAMKEMSEAIMSPTVGVGYSEQDGQNLFVQFASAGIKGIVAADDKNYVAKKIRAQIRGLNEANVFYVEPAPYVADPPTPTKTLPEVLNEVGQDITKNPDAWVNDYDDCVLKCMALGGSEEYCKSVESPCEVLAVMGDAIGEGEDPYLISAMMLEKVQLATVAPSFSFDIGTEVSLEWGSEGDYAYGKAGYDRKIRFKYKQTAPGHPNTTLEVYVPSTGELIASYKTRKVGLPINFYMLYQEENGLSHELNGLFLHQFAWPNNAYGILLNSIFEDLLRFSGDNGLYLRENFIKLHLNKYSPWSTLKDKKTPNPEKCFLGFFNKNVLNNQTNKMIEALSCLTPDSVGKNATTISFVKMLLDCLFRVVVVKESMKTLFTFGLFNKSHMHVKDIADEEEDVPFFQIYFKKEIERALIKQFGVVAKQLFRPGSGLGKGVGKAVKTEDPEDAAAADAAWTDPCATEPALKEENEETAVTELQKFNDEIISEWVTDVTRILFQDQELTDTEALSINLDQQIAYVQEVVYRGIPDNVKEEQLSGALAAYQVASAKVSKNTFLENFDPLEGGSEKWIAEAGNLIKLEKLNAKAKLLTIENDQLEEYLNPPAVLGSSLESLEDRAGRLWFPYLKFAPNPHLMPGSEAFVELAKGMIKNKLKDPEWWEIFSKPFWSTGTEEEWMPWAIARITKKLAKGNINMVSAGTYGSLNSWTELSRWAYGTSREMDFGYGGFNLLGENAGDVGSDSWQDTMNAPGVFLMPSVADGHTSTINSTKVELTMTMTTAEAAAAAADLTALYPGQEIPAEVSKNKNYIAKGSGSYVSWTEYEVPHPAVIVRSDGVDFISKGVNSGLATDPYVEITYNENFYDNFGSPDGAQATINRAAFKSALHAFTQFFVGDTWNEFVGPLSKFLYETKLILLFPQMHDFLLKENFEKVKKGGSSSIFRSDIFWQFFQHNFKGGVWEQSFFDNAWIFREYSDFGSALSFQGKIYLSDWMKLTAKFRSPVRTSGASLAYKGKAAPTGDKWYGQFGPSPGTVYPPIVEEVFNFSDNGIPTPAIKSSIPHYPPSGLTARLSWGNHIYRNLGREKGNLARATGGKWKEHSTTTGEGDDAKTTTTSVWHKGKNWSDAWILLLAPPTAVKGFKCDAQTNAKINEQGLHMNNFFGWLYSRNLEEIFDIEMGYNITQYTSGEHVGVSDAKAEISYVADLPNAQTLIDEIIETHWEGSDYRARWDMIATLLKEKIGKVNIGANNHKYVAFPIFNVAQKIPGTLSYFEYIYKSKFDDAASFSQWMFTWPGEKPVKPSAITQQTLVQDNLPIEGSHFNFAEWAPQPIRVTNGALTQNPVTTIPLNIKSGKWIGIQETPLGRAIELQHVYRSEEFEVKKKGIAGMYAIGVPNISFVPDIMEEYRTSVTEDKESAKGVIEWMLASSEFAIMKQAGIDELEEAIGDDGIQISSESHINAACEAVAIPKNYMGTWWKFSDGAAVSALKADTVDVLLGTKYNTLQASTIRFANMISTEEDADPLFAYSETFFEMMSAEKKVAFNRIIKSFFLKEQTTMISIMHRILSQKFYPGIEYCFDNSTSTITSALMTAIAVARGDYQYAAPGTETDIPFPLDLSKVDWGEMAEMILKALMGAIASAVDPTWVTPWFFPGPFTPIGVAAKLLIDENWWGDDEDGNGRVRKTCEDALAEQTKLLDLGPFFNK